MLTVGRFGCTTTCISMLSDYFGCYKNPIELAHNVGNYTNDGLVLWENFRFDRMKFVRRVYGRNDTLIQEALKDEDKGVILQVNDGAHWVLPIKKNLIGNDYTIVDPWDGKKKNCLNTYRNITGSAFFARKALDEKMPVVKPLTIQSVPSSRLIKAKGFPEIYVWNKRSKYRIPDWETFVFLFGNEAFEELGNDIVSKLPEGPVIPSMK